MLSARKGLLEFGNFRLDVENKLLWSNGEPVQLPPKAVELLCALVETPGEVVSKDEIWKRVWDDAFVEETNLTHNIYLLRKAFKNFGEEELIATVPRRGYRFTGTVKRTAAAASEIIFERQVVSQSVIEEVESAPARLPGKLRFGALKTALAVLLAAALTTGGYWYYRRAEQGSAATRLSSVRSLAILPFKSFSSSADDPEQRLRITDAVITKIGTFDKLVVRPTNSILRFTAGSMDAVEAGKTLSVDAVLDGHIQSEHGRLRVTVQLISVPSGEQLWSGQFDGREDEVLALQDAISAKLRQDFGFSTEGEFNRPAPANNDAYEAYLKGRYLWNQRKKESYFKALEYFEKSIADDPNFALGYTGISDCYHLLQQTNVMPTRAAFEKAEWAARRAYDLDPQLSEANISMGSVNFIRYSKFAEAERFYRRAIELNPNSAEPYARLGMLLNVWGRTDEAYDVLKKAEELDPTSINNAIYLGANYYFSRQFDRAEEQFKRILEFAPGTERAHFFLERIYEINNRYDEAVEHSLAERASFRPESVEPLRKAYETGGIKAFWRKQIEYYKDESRFMYGLENHIASRYALLGEAEPACDFVEKNIDEVGTMWNYGRVDPIFDTLRSYPRFQQMIRKAAPEI